jgi:hypothetical protein
MDREEMDKLRRLAVYTLFAVLLPPVRTADKLLRTLFLTRTGREKGDVTMTQQEAKATIEAWIKTYSFFAAEAVSITPDGNGAWVGLVECSEVIWKQKVSPAGEVSAPVWVD